MNFISDYRHPDKTDENSYWFLISDQKIHIISQDEKKIIPRYRDIKSDNIQVKNVQYMGRYDDTHCYAAEIQGEDLPANYLSHRPLTLLGETGEDIVLISGLANQLVYWSSAHKYCGKCGKPTEDKKDERAKFCPSCSQVYYPRLSPAIIVAVVRDSKLLLANSPRFPAKFYSVLAGFVEPGENLEECVKREVYEEVGIEVKNIKYFGSQPWPYPDSLMVGFTAEYAGGEIVVDKNEIGDAGWFSREEIPRIPPSISIARKLIDWFINKAL